MKYLEMAGFRVGCGVLVGFSVCVGLKDGLRVNSGGSDG
jgi:hypothetical protein